MTGRMACAVVLSVLAAASAGCGGGGGGGSSGGGGGSSGSSSDPNSPNYNPAATTLKKAGLEVCSVVQHQAVGGLEEGSGSGSGVAATHSYDVAPHCKAKISPNQIIVYQFNGRQSLDAGLPKIRAAYPKGQVTEYGPLVIIATGPDSPQYMADLKKVLPAANS